MAAIEVDGLDSYNLQDDLGSPMQLLGYTGDQMEDVGGLYYAQARRYDALSN